MDTSEKPGDAATHSENDPRDTAPQDAENHDPHSGVSDDPRVDSTPDRRQST